MASFSMKSALDRLLNRAPADEELPPLEDGIDYEEGTDDLQDESVRPVSIPPKLKGKCLGVGFTNIDLTPHFFKEAVEVRELKKNWIFINAGVFALTVLILSTIFVSSLSPQSELQSQQESNTTLLAALGKYKSQTEALSSSKDTAQKLNKAAGSAINWETLTNSIQGSLPSGTSIASISINTGDSDEKGASMLIRFTANSPLGYADTLKAVQSARGVSNVQIGGLSSSGENSYQFSATFDYDSTIKTNRFQASTGGN